MNILFCGSCLPRVFESKIKMLSVAGNQYQNNLISNLRNKGEVHILSFVSIPLEFTDIEIVSACSKENYRPVLAHDKLKGVKEFRRRLKEEINWADFVITYNSKYPWFGIGTLAKRANARSVLVLADYTPPNEENSIPQKFFSLLTEIEFHKYKKVVLLSSGSSKYVSQNQESVVINGCLDMQKFECIKPKIVNEVINIVYTGVLSKVTGVDLLIEAFKYIDNENVRLIICGQGDELNELLAKEVARDSRICFKGFLSTNEYMNTIQEADILVNPRNMNFIQNQNNFPSKILEYLASGRKVVSTKFNGFQEYKDHVIFVDSDAKSMTEGLERAIDYSDTQIYYKNRLFVQQFDWNSQIEKFM